MLPFDQDTHHIAANQLSKHTASRHLVEVSVSRLDVTTDSIRSYIASNI